MLNVRLARLGNVAGESLGLTLEALAMSMLAYYTSSEVPARVTESHKRSWDFDKIKYFPRSVGHHPGFLFACTELDAGRRCVVAIEGTTSLNEYMPDDRSTVLAIPFGTEATAYYSFVSSANQIATKLLADADFTALRNSSNTVFVFTGHSLGAAIASILVKKFAMTYSMRHIRECLFACPRVGTESYNSTRIRTLSSESHYTEFDPIDILPSCAVGAGRMLSGPVLRTLTFLRRPEEQSRWTWDGKSTYRPRIFERYPVDFWARLYTGGRDNFMHWNDHKMRHYRLTFSNMIAGTPGDLALRFLHCEFPDSTNWGWNFKPGMRSASEVTDSFDESVQDWFVPGSVVEVVTQRAVTNAVVPPQVTTAPPPVVAPIQGMRDRPRISVTTRPARPTP